MIKNLSPALLALILLSCSQDEDNEPAPEQIPESFFHPRLPNTVLMVLKSYHIPK